MPASLWSRRIHARACRLAAAVALSACSGSPTDTTPAPPVTPTPVPPVTYVAGQSYFGRNSYVEYIAGNSPVILSAPHGGLLTPSSIPDRTASA